MLNLNLNDYAEDFKDMQEAFNQLGRDAIFMDHYDLEEQTGIPSKSWQRFLADSAVQDYVAKELFLITQAERNKIIRGASKNKAVSTAPMLKALSDAVRESTHKDGPIFIYTYVPMSQQEQKSEHARVADASVIRRK